MSQKDPIQASPCDSCDGWFKCRVKAIVCWAQESVEWLCERNRGALTQAERALVESEFRAFHRLYAGQVISERLTKIDYTDRQDVIEWFECARAHGFATDARTLDVAKGQLTFWNRLGLLPVAGLSCMCCAGWRVWFAGVAGVFSGAAVTAVFK